MAQQSQKDGIREDNCIAKKTQSIRTRLKVNSPKPELNSEKDNKQKRSQEIEAVQPNKRSRLAVERLKSKLKEIKRKLMSLKGYLARAENRLQYRFDILRYNISTFVSLHLVKVFRSDAIPEQVEETLAELSSVELLDSPFKLWGKGSEVGLAIHHIISDDRGGEDKTIDRWRVHATQVPNKFLIDDKKTEALVEHLLHLIIPLVIKKEKNVVETRVNPRIIGVIKWAKSTA
ncbi:hypothetical protein F4781DRAFT_427081 [Annulohypoxylon bovei var. microspora]|nr:hypothetical protein F4781DRAFT_427081 [Annulohypoxylon bovei var. microspora]